MIEPKDLPPEVGVADGVNAGEPGSGITVVTSADTTLSLPLSNPLPASLPVRMLADAAQHSWEHGLELDASVLLKTDRTDVWDELTRRFESRLISAALAATRGRRIEAAQKLGIGRNTITRKIQELGLE